MNAKKSKHIKRIIRSLFPADIPSKEIYQNPKFKALYRARKKNERSKHTPLSSWTMMLNK